jgi:hypothetical protein
LQTLLRLWLNAMRSALFMTHNGQGLNTKRNDCC